MKVGLGLGGGRCVHCWGAALGRTRGENRGGRTGKRQRGGGGGGGSAVTSYSQPFTGQKPGGMVVMKTGQAPGIIQWNVKKLSSPALHSPPQDTVTPKIFHTKTVQSTPPAPHSPPQDTKDNLNQDNAVHTTCTAQSSTVTPKILYTKMAQSTPPAPHSPPWDTVTPKIFYTRIAQSTFKCQDRHRELTPFVNGSLANCKDHNREQYLLICI